MNSELLATNLIHSDPSRLLQLENELEKIAHGDEAALIRLYDVTVRQVYSLAYRITRSRTSSEEIVNDVYLKIWHFAKNYDPTRGKALVWLLTICRSKSLDHLRAADTALSLQDTAEIESDQVADNPQDILLAVERNSAVHAALHGLDARDRQIISLAFFRGMTHSEIADHLDLPLGTIKSSMRRTLIKLGAQKELR